MRTITPRHISGNKKVRTMNKTTRLFIRVTDDEHAQAETVAASMGLRTISQAVRVLLDRAAAMQASPAMTETQPPQP